MSEIIDWLYKYGESHQNKTNKVIHCISVPIIFFTLLGILSQVQVSILENIVPYEISNLACIIILFGMFFYLKLSFVMFVGVGIFTILHGHGIYFLNHSGYDLEINTGLFLLSWIGQFIGHKIEGIKPSFFEDLKFLLNGPAWLIALIFIKLGIRY